MHLESMPNLVSMSPLTLTMMTPDRTLRVSMYVATISRDPQSTGGNPIPKKHDSKPLNSAESIQPTRLG
jgi:hypothetical protein